MKKKEIKRSPLLSKLLYVAGTIVLAAVVYLTIEMATSGAALASLEREEAGLTSRKQALNEELIKASSLTSLTGVSESLGFVSSPETIFITQEEAVAKLP